MEDLRGGDVFTNAEESRAEERRTDATRGSTMRRSAVTRNHTDCALTPPRSSHQSNRKWSTRTQRVEEQHTPISPYTKTKEEEEISSSLKAVFFSSNIKERQKEEIAYLLKEQ